MTVHWTWGLTTAVLLAVVIHLNGRGIRLGWLLGALVQLVNMGFGWAVYHQWTFGFLAIPAALFMINWWRHPKRKPQGCRAATSQEIFTCDSRKDDMHCDRVRDHSGLHVGFQLANDGKLNITQCWSDSFYGVMRMR